MIYPMVPFPVTFSDT